MSEFLSLVAVALAVVALYLAWRSIGQLGRLDSLVSKAHSLLEEVKRDLGTFEAMRQTHGSELEERIDATHEDVRVMARGLGVSLERAEEIAEQVVAEVEQENLSEAYAHMYPVSVEELSQELADAVRDASDGEPSWALRRRGRGRPRWLIGTSVGGPWRVTVRQDGPAIEEAPALADRVVPVPLESLGEGEAVDALLNDGSNVERAEIDDVAYRRLTRGVPVYYTFVHPPDGPSQVWRLVQTRWGWSAAQEMP